MTIVLDTTNILQSGYRPYGISLTLLGELARERHHRLVLPDVVVEELRAKRLDAARSDIHSLKSALSRVRAFHSIPKIQLPTPESVTERWIDSLQKVFEFVSVEGHEAREAISREASGLPPSIGKRGARDAAIWIVVKRLHLSHEDETFFVSHNTNDFGDPDSPTELHPGLLAELGAAAKRFRYVQTIDALLSEIGIRIEEELVVADLENEAASEAVRGWARSRILRRAFDAWREFGLQTPSSLTLIPEIEELPVAIRSSETFEVDGRRVVVTDCRWQVSYEVFEFGEYGESLRIAGDLNIHLLLRELEGGARAAEVIGGSDAALTGWPTFRRSFSLE